MSRTVVHRTIAAPVTQVFATVSDIRMMAQALPHVVRYEFLSRTHSGLGTRFREVRLMRGKESPTELEITEYAVDRHVRMVADSHGTIWDTLFAVAGDDSQTELTLTMDARAYKLLPRIINRFIKGMITKAVEEDADLIKAFCETTNSR